MLLLTELMVAVVPWLASRTGGAPAFCALTAPQQLGAGLLLTHLIVLLHPRAKPVSHAMPLPPTDVSPAGHRV